MKKQNKTNKQTSGGFQFFISIFLAKGLIFLQAFSWETDLWVTLGDFTVKNAKFGGEIYI